MANWTTEVTKVSQHSKNTTSLFLQNIVQEAMLASKHFPLFWLETSIPFLACGSLLKKQGGKADYKLLAL